MKNPRATSASLRAASAMLDESIEIRSYVGIDAASAAFIARQEDTS